MLKGKSYSLFILVLLLFLLAACSSDSSGKETGGVSGDLSFYTSQPDADAEQLVAAFSEKYPDVNVSIYRSGTEEVISKVQAEKQAGEIQADVLLVADAVTFESLKEQDMLLPYESEELAGIPEQFVDPDHTYTGTKVMSTAIAVNTNNVSELPTSWMALTEAPDNISMPSPLYSGAAAYNLGVFTRTDNFGWGFYEKIQANNPTVTQGNGAVLKAVAAGETDYGMVVDFIVARAEVEGSPVTLVYPEEGVPVITEPIGIMKDSQNEAAAKAFVDFVLSEEGQILASEIGYTPIREGVEAPEGLKTIEDMKVIDADTTELYQAREEDKQKFSQLFGE
ncbi:iron(III) transport system substrate-binding protein [Gracilibacillus ureilyticus]|uniref:Iron(III) transport system substrate-binding protein n=1 Tax=Gracilibacillus ureilyticus TaxID=531814 RepID=A0A1H9URG1_9BACI|nr:ABC transporter substrate-binding protein [Gracilibacillus ureilyticus]SES11986.1 iron(III) transport system substrate-binding protein [Gracilibacillus ureilyticus]